MPNSLAPKLVAEFIGTFAFVFIGVGAAGCGRRRRPTRIREEVFGRWVRFSNERSARLAEDLVQPVLTLGRRLECRSMSSRSLHICSFKWSNPSTETLPFLPARRAPGGYGPTWQSASLARTPRVYGVQANPEGDKSCAGFQ